MTSITGQTASAPTSSLSDLSRLTAIEEIRALKARYLWLLDTHQWDDLTELFAPDAKFVIARFDDPIVFRSRAEWIDYVRPMLDGGSTVHQVHQGEIEVRDHDTAWARWAMTDHVKPAASSGRASFHGHGHYTEQYRRIDGSWRIVALTLTRLKLTSPDYFD